MDLFLCPTEGPYVRPKGNEEQQKQAWVELWDSFEFWRLISARPEVWRARFTTGLAQILTPGERLALPGEAERVVFVTSDATPELHGACDWTFGYASQEKVLLDLKALQELGGGDDPEGIAISVAELLGLVAFAAARAPDWQGKP